MFTVLIPSSAWSMICAGEGGKDERVRQGSAITMRDAPRGVRRGAPTGEAGMLRILLADDHTILRHGLREILQSLKHYEIVGEAVDGDDAVRQGLATRPDIVVMDIGMPGLNGIETTSVLKATLPQSKILVLTMHEHLDVIADAFHAGAFGYMIKTESDAEMIRGLRAISRGYMFFSSRVATVIGDAFRHHLGFNLQDEALCRELDFLESSCHAKFTDGEGLPSVEIFNGYCLAILTRVKDCLVHR